MESGNVVYAGKSHKGMVRSSNQDSFRIIKSPDGKVHIFVIADGMGGHNSGELASGMAVSCAVDFVGKNREKVFLQDDYRDIISRMMAEANASIFNKAQEDITNVGMGTTMITAIFDGNRLFIGHIGDSRVYMIKNTSINKITVDHSLIEEMINSGAITREEAKDHPSRNIITKAIGCTSQVEIDTYFYNVENNDIIVLCTDGLTNMVAEEEIKRVVEESRDPEEACSTLVDMANDRGGIDNITVIVIYKR